MTISNGFSLAFSSGLLLSAISFVRLRLASLPFQTISTNDMTRGQITVIYSTYPSPSGLVARHSHLYNSTLHLPTMCLCTLQVIEALVHRSFSLVDP